MSQEMKSPAMPGHLVRRLHQLATLVFMTRAREHGFELTPVQFAAMDAILHNPGIDQATVAELIAYDRATIGGVIDRLEAKGLLSRRISKRDRRARELELTEEGFKMFHAILPLVEAMQNEILGNLAPKDRTRFMELSRKVLGLRASK